MSATRLLVLAVVRAHKRAHGYIVGQDLLKWQADKWANTKTGSIYHALRQLTKDGLLKSIEVEATEAAAARTDYEITKDGEVEFQRLMEEALTRPEPRPDMLCSGLVFMSALPRETVLGYLQRRRATLMEHKTAVLDVSGNAQWTGTRALPPHLEALFDFWLHNTSTGSDWVGDLIARIEGGAYIFADDSPKAFGQPGSRMALH